MGLQRSYLLWCFAELSDFDGRESEVVGGVEEADARGLQQPPAQRIVARLNSQVQHRVLLPVPRTDVTTLRGGTGGLMGNTRAYIIHHHSA